LTGKKMCGKRWGIPFVTFFTAHLSAGPFFYQDDYGPMKTNLLLALTLLSFSGLLAAEAPKAMPSQDVIEVPAIRDGLCVSNLFQTNMVLQR